MICWSLVWPKKSPSIALSQSISHQTPISLRLLRLYLGLLSILSYSATRTMP